MRTGANLERRISLQSGVCALFVGSRGRFAAPRRCCVVWFLVLFSMGLPALAQTNAPSLAERVRELERQVAELSRRTGPLPASEPTAGGTRHGDGSPGPATAI